MKKLPILKPGDSIEIIAPASRCTDQQLEALKALFTSWQLNCLVEKDIFGEDLFCANTDATRFKHLKNALHRPQTKAIICARGGYGSMRLIPALTEIALPEHPKIFVGMSDTTALQLYLQQQWQWPTIHGAAIPDRFSQESIASLKSILFGEVKQVEFSGLVALNQQAQNDLTLTAPLIGGNLCLVQAGIGTSWQLDGQNKIIFLEDIGERGYRVDRMLEHLRQAHIFKNASAILLGDFLEGQESNGKSFVTPALKRFAENCEIPVAQMQGVGHGYINFPFPLGTKATLKFGNEIKLSCTR